MALIRHAAAHTLARDALVLDLGDLKRQADELKASAEEEAAQIVRDASEKRKEIIEGAAHEGHTSGRTEGYAIGLIDGLEEGQKDAFAEYSERLENVSRAFESALEKFETAREELVFNAQEDGLRLVLEIARRVTLRSVMIDRDSLRDRLKESLSRVLDPSKLTVRIHPDDVKLVNEITPQIIGRLSESSEAEVIEDPSLSPGDAVIFSGRGWIDTSIGVQLERVINELMPGFDAEPAPSSLEAPRATPSPEVPPSATPSPDDEAPE